jgi:NAD(P)-dependent dehydrogenase (short-subunit alcohol dehydrogenase family)/acyl carrier protein
LIDFVVEMTGYPTDMFDLDTDLEADLGIDSIKKAQLFGEIGEHFQIPPDPSLSLDDFPTLRHVMDYIEQTPSYRGAASASSKTPLVEAETGRFEASELASVDRWITRRFSLCMVDEPLGDATGSPMPSGTILVVGDNDYATALVSEISKRGGTARHLVPGDDVALTLERFEAFASAGQIHHLVLLTAAEASGANSLSPTLETYRLRNDRLLAAFAVAQRWYDQVQPASAGESASLSAITTLGGDFDLSGNSPAVEGGGIAGLLKAVATEAGGTIRARVVDFPIGTLSQEVADRFCDEQASNAPDVEVGYLNGRRQVLRAVPVDAEALSPAETVPSGAWVVTGGARGITAAVALQIARRWNVKLHLIGSTAPAALDAALRRMAEAQPKQLRAEIARQARASGESAEAAWSRIEKSLEIDRTLSAYAQAGVAATYHSCDVADREALARVLDTIRDLDGPIHGILHGAGVEAACKFPRKLLASVERTLAIKAGGAAALAELTADDPVRHFVAFTSTSGRFGGIGQTDYAMANEMLAKITARFGRAHPGCRAVAMHWGPWDEVGMAARRESRFAIKAMNLALMPVREGVAHVLRELVTISVDHEALFTNFPGSPVDEHPTMPGAAKATRYDRWRERAVPAGAIDRLFMDCPSKAIGRSSSLAGKKRLASALIAACVEAAEALVDGGQAIVVEQARFAAGLPASGAFEIDIDVRQQRGRCEAWNVVRERDGSVVEARRVLAVADLCIEPKESNHVAERSPAGNATFVAIAWPRTALLDLLEAAFELAAKQASHDGAPSRQIIALCDGRFDPRLRHARRCRVAIDQVAGQPERTAISIFDEAGALVASIGEVTFGTSQPLAVQHAMRERNPVPSETQPRAPQQREGLAAASAETARRVPRAATPRSDVNRQGHVAVPSSAWSLIDTIDVLRAGVLEGRMTVRPMLDPFAFQYKLCGRHAMPGSVLLELFAEAAAALVPEGTTVLGFEHVDFGVPQVVAVDEELMVSVSAHAAARHVACRANVPGSTHLSAGSATIVLSADRQTTCSLPAVSVPPFGWTPFHYPDLWPMVFHGPAYRCFRQLAFQSGGGWAAFVAAGDNALVSANRSAAWLLPVAILEGCFLACGVFQHFMLSRGEAAVPRKLATLRLLRPIRPNEACTMRFEATREAETSRFNFIVYGDDTAPLLDGGGLELTFASLS